MAVQVIEADLENHEHGEALVTLIDTYARGAGGQSAPISDEAAANLVAGLRWHPAKLILLAKSDDTFAGGSVCYWLFSTFAGKSFLNVHDLTVLPAFQNRGIGSALLSEIERLLTKAELPRQS